MLTGSTPSAGPTVAASAQVFEQSNVIVGPSLGTFNLETPAFANGGTTNLGAQLTIPVMGVPWIRVQVFHYGVYNDGLAVWRARPFIAWRVVGFIPPDNPKALNRVIGGFDPVGTLRVARVPMSTPQTTTVNQPVSLHIRGAGLYSVGVSFDVTSGVAAADQGYDRFLVSISAGS
jgi:hypothetical protein